MGSFYSFGELRLGQGRENSRSFLIDNPKLTSEIETLIRAAAIATPVLAASNGARPKAAVAADEDAEDEGEG